MSGQLMVAGVGAGFFSGFHYDAWSRMPGVTLAGLCDLDVSRARAMAERHGIGSVFDDAARMLEETKPDLFDIAVPPVAHLDLIRLGVRHGVPMICQKPFCNSLEGAEAAVRLCEDAGVPLVIHENFRFQPWYRRIKALLDEDALGEIYQVSFRLRPGDGQGPDAYLDRQPYFQKMERFLVHETAIHLIDVFRYLFGDVTRVYADLARLNPAIAGEDAGMVVFNFASGTRGLFDGNRLVDHPARNRRLTMGELLVEGEVGCLHLNGDGRIFRRDIGSNDWAQVEFPWQDRGFGGDCVYAFQAHVVDALAGNGAIENTARDYLANLRIEDAVYRSNETACAVDLT